MQEATPLFLSDRKLAGVHGLRGCAAASIVLFHLQAIPGIGLPTPVSVVVSHLYLSVVLFFALSAFTIAHSAHVAPTNYTAYLRKRFFRIAPLFYVVLAWNLTRTGVGDLGPLLANLTFTFNLVPGQEQSFVWAGWSVGVEMLAYLLLPALLLTCKSAWTAASAFGFSVVVSVMLWHAFEGVPGLPKHYTYFFIGSNLCCFLAGILAYRIFGWVSQRRSALRAWTLGCVALAVFALAYIDPLYVHYRSPGLYFAAWAFAFALVCAWQAHTPAKLLASKPMQWLGDRSFSIYLFHPIVIELCRPLYAEIDSAVGGGGMYTYVICILVTMPILLAIAEASYLLIEMPGIRLGSSLSAKLNLRRQSSIKRADQGHAVQAPLR